MKHYIQYRKAEPGNAIHSRPGFFEIWVKANPKQPNRVPPGQPGDIMWLLSAHDEDGRKKHYLLNYYFEIDTAPAREEDRIYLRGTKGRMFKPPVFIDSEEWFPEFFNKIGHGGISVQEIPPEFLTYFLNLLQAAPEGGQLDQLLATAEKAENSEEAIALRAIKTRRGQAQFRENLLAAYGKRCAFTGCQAVEALEAAHIVGHGEETNYAISNGLLLRADLHTLFDLHLVGVDAWDRIVVSNKIVDTEYRKLHGQKIRLPIKMGDRPSQFGLAKRLEKLRAIEND